MVTKTLWREKSSIVYTAAWAMVLSPLIYLIIVLSIGGDFFSGLADAIGRLDFDGAAEVMNGLASFYAIPLLSLFFSLLYLYGLTGLARLQEEADRRALMHVRTATIVPLCVSVLQLLVPASLAVMKVMLILSLLAFAASNIIAIIGFGQLRRSPSFPEKGRAAAGLLRANSIWQLIGFVLVLIIVLGIYGSASSARSYQDYENVVATAGIMGALMVIIIVVFTIICVCLFLSGWAMMHNARPVTAAASVEVGRVSIAGAPSGGMFAGAVALCIVMSVVWPYIYHLAWGWTAAEYNYSAYESIRRVLGWVQALSFLIGWVLLLFAFVKVMEQKPQYRQACLWIVAACGLQLLCTLLSAFLNQSGNWSTGWNYIYYILNLFAVGAFFAGFWQMNVAAENRLTALGARVLMGLMGLYALGDLLGIVAAASADGYNSPVASFCYSVQTAIPWMALYLAIAGYRYLLSGLYGGGDLQPADAPSASPSASPAVASVSSAPSVPPVSPVPPVSSVSSVPPVAPVQPAPVDGGSLRDSLRGKSDAELDAILNRPNDYQPDLVVAVCEEKERRLGKTEGDAPVAASSAASASSDTSAPAGTASASPAPAVSHRPEDVLKAMTAGIGAPTATESTKAAPEQAPAASSSAPTFVPIGQASGGGKSRTGLVVTLCLLAVLLVGGALAYFLWYVPYAKDRDAERTYVYATNLFLRSEKLAGVEYNVTGKLPYGTELITYTRDAEWAEVKAGDKKGFVAAPYLMTRADFDLLDSAWGDMESREHIITTKCRQAMVDFYKRASLTGGTSGWQVYSMGRDVKPNTIFYPRVYRKDSKYTDFFFIVHNNTTGERMLAAYSFDDLTEEPIFRTGVSLSTRASISAATVNRRGNVQVTFSDGSRLELPR